MKLAERAKLRAFANKRWSELRHLLRLRLGDLPVELLDRRIREICDDPVFISKRVSESCSAKQWMSALR